MQFLYQASWTFIINKSWVFSWNAAHRLSCVLVVHRMQLQNDVNPSLQFPATKQRDEYIHVLGCCKTPINLSAIKPMFLCCGGNKHFIALVTEGFALFFWSQLWFQGLFVNCLFRYPSTSAEASALGQPLPMASRVTQAPSPCSTHRSGGRGVSWEPVICGQNHLENRRLCSPGKTGVLNQDKMSKWHFCRNGFAEKFNFLGPEVVFSLCVAASLGTGEDSPGTWRALILPTSSCSSPFAAGTCQEDRELVLTSSSLPGKQLLNSLFAQSGTGECVAGSSWASLCFDSPRKKCILKNFLFPRRKHWLCEKGIFLLKNLLLENSPTSSFSRTYSHRLKITQTWYLSSHVTKANVLLESLETTELCYFY